MTAQQSGDAPCLQISTLLCTRRSGRLLCTVFVSGAPSQRPANARQPLLTASAPHTVPTGIRPDPTGCTPPAPALPPAKLPPRQSLTALAPTGDTLNRPEDPSKRPPPRNFHRRASRASSQTTSLAILRHPFRLQTDVAPADAMTEVGHTDLSRLLQSKRNEFK